MSYDNETSTAAYWDRRAKAIDAETDEARELSLSRQGQLQALSRKIDMMYADSDAEIAAVQAQIDLLTTDTEAAFAAEWTAETTQARRAAWNTWVRSQSGKVSSLAVANQERAQGWQLVALKKAVALHGLA